MELRVDNAALRGGTMFFLPKMRDAASAYNRIEKGDTCFTAVLPSRRPALFEAFCALSGLPESGRLCADVSSRKDVDMIVYTARLNNRKAFRTAVTPRWIQRYSPRILVNGREFTAGQEILIPSKAELKIVFSSEYFRDKAEIYLAFPFTDKAGRPSFAIRLPENPNASEQKEAGNLKGYFEYAAARKITSAGEIPVLQGTQASGAPAVHIAVGRKSVPEIRVDETGNIRFNAPDGKTAVQMMKDFNYVMDRRYPYIFKASPFRSLSPELIEKFELKKYTLPWSRCFEQGGGL